MIEQSDIQGRLRLFRYGLVVLVVVTFLVSILAPVAATSNIQEGVEVNTPPITDFLGNAILYSVVVGVLAIIVYFIYARVLENTVGDGKSDS